MGTNLLIKKNDYEKKMGEPEGDYDVDCTF